jgi:hypothetical protein
MIWINASPINAPTVRERKHSIKCPVIKLRIIRFS